MNRYKKKVVLLPKAAGLMLNTEPLPNPAMYKAGSRTWKAEPWDWAGVFGRSGPVEVEIGFGTGGFLLPYARQQPEMNLLGIEITRKMAHLTANRAWLEKLANLRLALGDARYFLAYKAPPASVAAVHVYFPDPWVKKRHLKRRVINLDMVRQVRQVLKPGGRLHFATDHAEYFSYFLGLMEKFPEFRLLHTQPPAIKSAYETKWRADQREIFSRTYQLEV